VLAASCWAVRALDRSASSWLGQGGARGAGVALGAILGHVLATAIAVLGGEFAGRYISEKTIAYVGGSLFLVFAVATALGYI